MKINELFKNEEPISLLSYLEKCGVKDFKEYINPTGKYIEDYRRYKDLIEACKEIEYWKSIKGSKITIIQDCDGDGVCSTVELFNYLYMLNSDWDINVLIHTSKQRGLDDEDIMNAIRESRPNLVIVPDAGTNDGIYAEELCDLGIGLIVLDHHNYEKTVIKKGILVNNQNINYDVQRNGSGALVTHKFLQAMDDYFNVNYSYLFIDMVALSLVSDSMNMAEMENREYYHFGLETIECVNNEFLKALIIKFIGDKEYSQRDLSFRIIPKINAVCRSQNQETKQRLFLAFVNLDNYEEVLSLCEEAHKYQISKVEEIMEANKDIIDNTNDIVLFSSDDIPRSYSGLVCGKIMNYFGNKPSIVGSCKDGYFIGSLRSPIPLINIIKDNEYVDFAKGHDCSCGVGIYEENIDKFIQSYNALKIDYTPSETVLKEYSIKSIPNNLFGLFSGLDALWGKSITKPTFCINDIIFNPNDIQILGSNKRTIKLISNGISFLIFNCTKQNKVDFGLGYLNDKNEFVECVKDTQLELKCIGSLDINRYKARNGKLYENNQMIVDKFEISKKKTKTAKDFFK